MKTFVIISLLFAVAHAQFFPGFNPFFRPGLGFSSGNDEYAASLAGAPVGLYSKSRAGGFGGGFPYGGGFGGFPFGGGFGGFPFGGGFAGSDVSGASLGGVKVGIYGKERPQQPAFPSPIVPFGSPLGLPIRRPGQSRFRPATSPVYRPPAGGSRY